MTLSTYEITDSTPMPFGRYIGKPMSGVPAVYLVWLHDKGCKHDGVRKYITNNLADLRRRVARIPKNKRR